MLDGCVCHDLMNPVLLKGWTGLVLLAVVQVGCSRDPAKEKAAFLKSAEDCFKAGKYQDAVIQFRNSIEIDPKSAIAHHHLALAYLKLKAPQLAYKELLATVELDPGNTDAQLQLAALLVAGGKYAEAQKIAEKIIAADPRNARAHTILGQTHAAVRAWPQAIRELETAIAVAPDQFESYAGLALVYASTDRAAEAEAILRKATEANPKSLDAFVNLGRFYLVQHRLVEAEREMRRASEVDPRATLPRKLLTEIYMDSGRMADAERVCRDLKSVAPDDPDGFGALASLYEATGQKAKAAEELQGLVVSRPKDIAIKVRLTDTLIDLNRLDDAYRLNQELLNARPGHPGGLTAKGRILIARRRYDEAKTVLAQAVQADPKSGVANYLLGVAESSLGQIDSARKLFAHALDLSPGMEDAAVALADLLARSGDYDDALRRADQVLQKNPGSTLAHVVAAKSSLAQGNSARAEAQLKAALELDPAFVPALGALLDLRATQGRTEEVLHRLSELLSKRSRNAKLHLLLGIASLKLNDLDKAEESVKQALAIDPGTPDAYGVLAEISHARGALERAAVAYRLAIEGNPGRVESYMALAGVYSQQGKWDEAKRVTEHAHALDPVSPFIANNLAYLYIEHGGDISVALSLAQQAKRKLPDSPIVSDTMGWAYYKLGSPAAAVSQLRESVMRAPDNAMYQYHLGMAYIASGRPVNATQSLQRALSDDPDFPYAATARAALDQITKGTP